LEFISINNTKYFYRISKRGLDKEPAVICLHGSGADSVVWSYQLSRLSRYFKIIIPDLPGHGQSEGGPFDTAEAYAHWLNRFSESLSLNSFFLMGHSFGGAIAQEYARHYTKRVKGLVLIGTGTNFRFSKIYRKLQDKGIDLLNNEKLQSLLSAMNIPHSFIKQYQSLKNMSSSVLHDDLLAAGKFNSSRWISSIKIPALVIWGKNDAITPRELPQHLADLLPIAEFQIIENSGHVVMIDARDTFNTSVKGFIKKENKDHD